MNPITPPDLERFDKPEEKPEPATDEARRPDSTDDPNTGMSKDLPAEPEPESQAPER